MNIMPLITSRLSLLTVMIFTATVASATDFSSNFQVAQGVPGQAMVQAVGDTTNSIVNLLMGPGMYVVMALGAVLALYGYGRGNKETLVTGVILFVLAAILRGIWGLWA
jgi:hypothetical protein